VTAQRVASNTGVIMVAGQKIALGRIHARRIVTAEVITIDLGEDDTRTIRRTTTQPVRSIKAQQRRRAAHVPRPTGKHVLGLIRQASGWDQTPGCDRGTWASEPALTRLPVGAGRGHQPRPPGSHHTL
jgi:hypothetical protein